MSVIEPLPPGSTIGILGGGQLGRMLAVAAAKLGLRAHVFAPQPDSPAFDVTAWKTCAAYDDAQAVAAFAEAVDATTFEFENIPAGTLEILERRLPVSPPRAALEIAQHRLREKAFLTGLAIPVAPYRPVSSADDDLPAAFADMEPGDSGRPLFLKRAKLGYDGKGQFRIAGAADLERARLWLGGGEAVLEAAVDFEAEFSIIAVRGRDGATAYYDPVRNTHVAGILRESAVPAGITGAAAEQARALTQRILDALDYVGVLGVELFLLRGQGGAAVIVNEIAPRVHNSGHWTLDACPVSQFENHIRAVAGWPLGATDRFADVRMVNLLGAEAAAWRELVAADGGRSLHLYGKRASREGRKMGHYAELAPVGRT